MIDPEPDAELRVPRPGGAMLGTIGYSFVLLFILVAGCNLLYANRITITALVASLLWLGLVAFVIRSNLREEGGIRQYVINRLGRYSRYHFVRATPANGKSDRISIGYTIFRRDQYYFHVKTNAISSLDWGTGQATAMGGRDMNDWHVALWYRHPEGPQRKSFPGVRDEEIYIIGPSGRRAKVESFGQQLVEFLIVAGVGLVPGENDCEFVTHSQSTANEQRDERES